MEINIRNIYMSIDFLFRCNRYGKESTKTQKEEEQEEEKQAPGLRGE
jgi:hypothetical protein